MGDIIANLFSNVGLVELLVFIGGIIFFAARLEENGKASKEIIDQQLKNVIAMIEMNYKSLSGDIQRLKEHNEDSTRNLKDDIRRLEQKADESNHVRERVCMLEASTKSAHHRIDTFLHQPHQEESK